MTDISGGCYMEKGSKGIPPWRRTKLSKKSQENQDEKNKLYEANERCNDWKSQLHWHKLEWVNPNSITKRDKPYSVSSKSFT